MEEIIDQTESFVQSDFDLYHPQKSSQGDIGSAQVKVSLSTCTKHLILTPIFNIFYFHRNYFIFISIFISCFPVGYREISVKIFFDLTLVAPVKIPIFMFLLPRLIACASQPDGNMTSFTLNFSPLT